MQEKKVLMLQNISFTADSVNSISEHDAEYLKHLTSVKVNKKKNLHNASLLTFCTYVPSIIHAALKTLVASCLFCSVLCVNVCVWFVSCWCYKINRRMRVCGLRWFLWYDWFLWTN